MRPQLAIVGFILLAGCATATQISLATLTALSAARADGAVALMKVDQVKQSAYRDAAKAVKNAVDLDKLETDRKSYTQKRDKTLLAFDKMGGAIKVVEDLIKAGTKFDLAPVFDAYKEVAGLLKDLGVKIPEVK